ncbi:thioredoxin-like 3-1, chloroplastic isoform X2 [Physcomitrium patens]|uniref:thioredoxin-like 3-1, chloroplastic isoform X2 n=1 Tax=Physcomitrium patens TaxID=3218 RepID=UPI000D178E7F|nr:thioredoxin-like 3-1, chloroplastic isoform X2 [Physcomitrium patens]|eukprot:XP_024370171.1 thioredoxin-like 3-1, chloroplastic isoform X2 [Physcomitrella patens]
MTSQCAQTRLSTNFSFLVTPKVLASCQKLTRTGLQNGTISLRGRCSRHCESDVSWEPRHLNSRIACMRAGEPSIPKPTWVEMTAITREDQFDEALESGNPIIIDWMATWCRKCVYLKPKLEKLAAEYHPDVKFYVVDVNIVPATLVTRAGVTIVR